MSTDNIEAAVFVTGADADSRKDAHIDPMNSGFAATASRSGMSQRWKKRSDDVPEQARSWFTACPIEGKEKKPK
jgi:hypothetical protein